MGELGSGLVLEGDGHQVREAPASGVADPHLTGAGLRVSEEFAEVLPGRIGLDGEGNGLGRELGHAGEGGVIELHVAGVIGCADAVGVPDQGVAVGGLAPDVAVSDGASRARPVDHDHRL
jgi:hypothetical protein